MTLLVVCVTFGSSSLAQLPVLTSRGDNARSGANTQETLLTPLNVNQNHFGRLFSFPVDYVVMAQPLYVPNVKIAGVLHNVVYVVTQADSVYAIDADTGAPLWHASMLNGGTTASGTYLPCGTSVGFNQEGIPGTPVIDPATNTMYLVAKTVFNATVRHHLHALDITTGNEQPGSPVLIQARSVSNKGHIMDFNSLTQKNRPGLLLLNGVVYLGFGSNYCNGHNSGWVISYDAATLAQLAVYNTSPDYGLTSIWQTGNGLAADEVTGNIFVETAEAGATGFDVPSGGQTYCNSVVKLSSNLTVEDYFTPWSVAYLNAHDLDLSATGALILPDNPNWPSPHELIAGGKQGVVYVLNRDSMGMFSPNDAQILPETHETPLVPNPNNIDVLMSSPAYWNNTVYFAPKGNPLMAFPLSGGLLGTPVKTIQMNPGSHSPSISANGNTNGIMWVISGPQLLAFDAVSLRLLYGTGQAPNGRDTLPPVGHFVTQTVANGRVYVATQTSLEAYGLFHTATVTGGNAQTATVGMALSAPIQIHVANPYKNGQVDVGVQVNFNDGCTVLGAATCGSFNPPSAVTDSNGNASTIYTVPTKAATYTVTASGKGFGSATATETALAGAPVKIISWSGAKQSGTVGSVLPKPIVAQVRDHYNNGVPGVAVNFSATGNGTLNPTSIVTDANGLASTTFKLPTTAGTFYVTASSTGLTSIKFPESALAGAPTAVKVVSGNNQAAPAGTQLPNALVVLVTDQYGNPVPNVSVTFDDGSAGGFFVNANPAMTDATGKATQFYTTPSSRGTITIHATAAGVATPAAFSETAQ